MRKEQELVNGYVHPRTKCVDYYLSLPYTILLKKDEDGDIVGKILELDGCIAHGPDEVGALGCLRECQRAWIESCLKSGQPVPEPEGGCGPWEWIPDVERVSDYQKKGSLSDALIQIGLLATGWKYGEEGVHLLRIEEIARKATECSIMYAKIRAALEEKCNAPECGGDGGFKRGSIWIECPICHGSGLRQIKGVQRIEENNE